MYEREMSHGILLLPHPYSKQQHRHGVYQREFRAGNRRLIRPSILQPGAEPPVVLDDLAVDTHLLVDEPVNAAETVADSSCCSSAPGLSRLFHCSAEGITGRTPSGGQST